MRRRRRAREGQEKRKRENKRLILKKLCAALLRSFRGHHSKKMKVSARGNRDPWEGQQPFRPNPNGAGKRTTTLRRLLISAVQCFLVHFYLNRLQKTLHLWHIGWSRAFASSGVRWRNFHRQDVEEHFPFFTALHFPNVQDDLFPL